MLLFGVKTGDSHAATALAAMGETGAVPDIRTALTTASGDHKVRFASAIHDLSPEDSSSNSISRELIEVLEKTDSPWSTRITAAIGLKDFGDAASEQALLKAVENDKDYLVRYHSCDSLLLRWGVEPPQISSHSDIFKLICDPREGDAIMDLPTRGREAVVLLEKLHNRDGSEEVEG
jgi:HEAT repeat protein